MISLLTTLRQAAPRLSARQFLAAHPGSWIQYFDDTPDKDPAKALSARRFDPLVARRKQREGCAIGFSVQPFGKSRTKDELLCFRTLGVDVDLVAAEERTTVPSAAIDQRKDAYLRETLRPFPLAPHWVIETRHGFHLLFRVQPQREPKDVDEAVALNRRLVLSLRGDPNAALLTQLLRVPGSLQFKVPSDPFLCRLLVDNAASIPPYPLDRVRQALDVWGPTAVEQGASDDISVSGPAREPRWQAGLAGVREGERNVTAASLVGRVLRSLPEDLWDTAGLGALFEWNRRNAVPLPERELRAVYRSIARREAARRRRFHATGNPVPPPPSAAC